MTADFPLSILAADLNADGFLDLVSADRAAGELSLFFARGGGEFDPRVSPAPKTGTSPRSVLSADLNSDGLLDLVSADADSG